MDEINDIIERLEKMLVKVPIDDDLTYACLSDSIDLLSDIKFQDHNGNTL